MSAGTCRGILSEISVITQEEREGAAPPSHSSRLLPALDAVLQVLLSNNSLKLKYTVSGAFPIPLLATLIKTKLCGLMPKGPRSLRILVQYFRFRRSVYFI